MSVHNIKNIKSELNEEKTILTLQSEKFISDIIVKNITSISLYSRHLEIYSGGDKKEFHCSQVDKDLENMKDAYLHIKKLIASCL